MTPKQKRTKKHIRHGRKKEVFLTPKMLKILKYAGIFILTITAMILVYFSEQAGMWFKASILEAPQAFNGTTLPVSKVPNFTYWSTQKSLKYQEIPESDLIDLPKYDLDKMVFPDEQLVWGNSSQDSIRNAKITYPVVYLGTYKYDHTENIGSHLAVDIKMPVGTPIHAIANGKVVTSSMDSSGFGHHVVIKHVNVPDPENPGVYTTLYSAYNHMDRIDVVEGENVLKGKIIGTSGNTGTSTTPHLHFQIDKDSAPWHPYWPFTWQESKDAGLSFFEAVNAGLGLSKAKTTTVNPIKFVEKYLNYNSVASTDNSTTSNTTSNTTTTTTTTSTTTSQSDPQSDPQPEYTESGSSKLFTYTITGERVGMVNNGVTLVVMDEQNQISTLSDSDVITAELTGVGSLLKKQFTKADFVNNSIKVIVKSSDKGTANVTVGKSSYQVSFVDQVKSVAKFKIENDGFYQKNVVETIKVIALDEDGNIAPAVNFTGVVNVTSNDSSVRITPDEIGVSDFKNGVADIKVIIPTDKPVKFRAQNGALVGESEIMNMEDSAVFTDVARTNPNYIAIKYLKDNDIIGGYSDGSFQPNKTVNRAEALKMLMLAFNVDVGGPFELNFSDVDKGAWYASTLSTAVARGIVKGYDDGTFKPSNTVNRAEYLKILFATNNMTPKTDITKPYDDVELTDWYAGYAFMTNKMNILETGSKLNPSNGMTRADVAETIYRMKMIQVNNLVSYSK